MNTKLDKLISFFCPNGVEFRRLDEIFHTRNGYTPSKSNSIYWNGDTCIPWFRMEDIRENGNILFDSIQHITPSAIKGKLFPKDSIIVATSATIGEHALIRVKSIANQRFTYLVLKEEYQCFYDIKFLYYYCYKLDEWCLSHLNQSSFASVDMGKFYAFMFPILPLEVQHEIVRILDNFTELTAEFTAELTAELTARKRQYEYYRKKILNNMTIDSTLIPVAELGKWSGGKTPSMAVKEFWSDGKISWISSKDMKTFVLSDTEDHITQLAIDECPMTLYPEGSVAIVTRSGILKHTFPVAYIPFKTTVNQDIKIMVAKEGVSSKYVAHALQAYGEDIRVKTKKQGGTVDSLDFQKVLAYKIPLPTMEIQNRIVNALDIFETICSDLHSSITTEIKARQKQYEYYRDQLLMFNGGI